MSWTYGEVMAALGDEAQAVPGGILVYRGKHIMVGLCHVGGGFDITPEGAEILKAYEEPVVAPRKIKAKAAPKAATESLDDVDLGE